MLQFYQKSTNHKFFLKFKALKLSLTNCIYVDSLSYSMKTFQLSEIVSNHLKPAFDSINGLKLLVRGYLIKCFRENWGNTT